MADILITDVPELVVRAYAERAVRSGRSIGEEIRAAITAEVSRPPAPPSRAADQPSSSA